MATHSSILAWRIPWSEEPGGLQSMELQRHDWSDLACMHAVYFPAGTMVKNLPANSEDTRDMSLIPGSWRSFGGKHDDPLLYSCLENSMDREAWQAMVHRVAKSPTQLKWLSMHSYVCYLEKRCIHLSVHCNIIFNSQDMEATYMPTDRNG